MGSAGVWWLISASAKAAVLLAASGLGAVLLRRSTAAARHQLWSLGVAGALLLPLLCWALPSVPLSLGIPTSGAGRSLLATAVLVTGGGSTGAGPSWPSWLALIWAAGVLLVSLRFVRGHIAARRLSRAAGPARAESWSTALREAAASLAITADVGLGRSEAIGSPMTVGVRRPHVLLPAAADAWSPQRLRAVLLHELGHVRRHDTLIQLVAQVACAVYWWNPLAWVAAARLRIEREHACDDLVLGAGVRPSSYAADLLEVARGFSPDEAAHAGGVSMGDLAGTETRLRRVLDPAPPRRPPGARFRLAARGSVLAIAVTLATTAPAATAPARLSLGSLSLGSPYADVVDHESRTPVDLTPDGELDLAGVEAEIRRHLGGLQECYERALVARPGLSGTVVLHWIIESTGKVEEQCIVTDTVDDADIRACVNKVVQDATFPPARGGVVDVSYPFVFAARR